MSRLESDKEFFKLNREEGEPEVEFPLDPQSLDTSGSPAPKERQREALEKFDLEGSQSLAVEPQTGAGKWRLSTEALEYLANARVLFAHGDFELAARLFGAVLQENPDHPGAMRSMADTLYALGDYRQAETCYRALLKSDASTSVLVRMGMVTLKLDKRAAAEEYFQDAIAIKTEDGPDLFEAYKQLGNLYVREGRFDEAEESYNRAYTMDPGSDILLVNYGTLEIQRGQLEKAVTRFREAAKANPSNEKAWVGLALIHREYGDLELAWGNLERALAEAPNDETALRLMCAWAFGQNKVRSAIPYLEDYANLENPDPEVLVALAQFLIMVYRLKPAQLYLVQAVTLNPEVSGAEECLQVIEEMEKANSEQVSDN